MASARKLKVFLCHSSGDKPAVRALYQQLCAAGVEPWLDEEDLLFGQEWEYAARAGGSTAYCFGDDAGRLSEYGWYHDNSGGTTHPVGQLKPNVWGLYDMHGNVWEWVQDWYDPAYYQRSPTDDPQGPEEGDFKVLRGGSYLGDQGPVRCASRYGFNPDYVLGRRGVRVVVLPKS